MLGRCLLSKLYCQSDSAFKISGVQWGGRHTGRPLQFNMIMASVEPWNSQNPSSREAEAGGTEIKIVLCHVSSSGQPRITWDAVSKTKTKQIINPI